MQLMDHAYNTAAATAALLNLNKTAASNQLPVNWEMLGIDPVVLAGLGLTAAQATSLVSSQGLQQPSTSSYLQAASAAYLQQQGASAFSQCSAPARTTQQMMGVSSRDWTGGGAAAVSSGVSQAQAPSAGFGNNAWQQSMPLQLPQAVHAANSATPPQTMPAGGYGKQNPQATLAPAGGLKLPSLSDSISRLSSSGD